MMRIFVTPISVIVITAVSVPITRTPLSIQIISVLFPLLRFVFINDEFIRFDRLIDSHSTLSANVQIYFVISVHIESRFQQKTARILQIDRNIIF